MPAYLSIELTTLSHADCSVILMDGDQNYLSGSADQQGTASQIAPKAKFEGAAGQSYLHIGQDESLLLIGAGKLNGEDDAAMLAAETIGASIYKAMRSH